MGTDKEEQGLLDVIDDELPGGSDSDLRARSLQTAASSSVAVHAPEIAPTKDWDGEWSGEVPARASSPFHAVNVDSSPYSPTGKLLPHQGGKVTSDWRPKITKKGLGTFMGVYVPCLLSIIGVILFLRLGWAVGQAGVMGTLGMFGIGGTMAILTDLSLSAMATNGRVAGGGTYYLLSRSVGPELGGSIGMVFAAANICGVAFYMQGFCETLKKQLPDSIADEMHVKLFGAGVLVFMVILCVFSSSIYSRSALAILCAQCGAQLYGNAGLLFHSPMMWTFTSDTHSGVTVMGNFTGPSTHTLSSNLWPDFDDDVSFGQVFGIVFPAMTGIMAGTNMSGVLRRPELAIPRGELSAITSAIFLYACMIVSLGACVDRDTLKNDYLILAKVTWWPTGLIIGVIVSTCSSALASIQSAARLLQALANDDIFPILSIFKTMWNGEPAIAILTSTVLAFCLLVIGSLNVLAPVLTMFMLITYAATNFATFLYTIAGHPNFRPRFRLFSWFTALMGGIICLVLMVYIQWLATLVSLVILTFLTLYVSRRQATSRKDWGDVTQALIFHQVRKYLLRLASAQHIKFWRARFLLITHTPKYKVNLLEFMNYLKKGGLFIIGDICIEETGGQARGTLTQLHRRKQDWQEFIQESKIKAFTEATIARSFREGVRSLISLAGLGGMTPNTLVIEIPDKESDEYIHARMNTVCDSKADRGRRVINKAAEWDAPLQDDAAHSRVSITEFVQSLLDAGEMDMNLILCGKFEELDLLRIQEHKPRQLSPNAQKGIAQKITNIFGHKDADDVAGPRGSSGRIKEKLRIDVWECPWGAPEDFTLSMQLADMLWKQDIWSSHTYIRCCSFVEDDDDNLSATKTRYADLHHKVVRKMRVPATIQVWVLEEEQPELWSRSMAVRASDAAKCLGSWEAVVAAALVVTATGTAGKQNSLLAAAPTSSINEGGSMLSSSDSAKAKRKSCTNDMNALLGHLPQTIQTRVLHNLIQQQSEYTAVTIIPMPELPVGRITDHVAKEYMATIGKLTSNIGPVLLISASAGVMTYEL